jgi:hypothetical protein
LAVGVKVQMPSGQTTTQTLVIPKGQSSSDIQILSKERGITSVWASPASTSIRPAKTDVFVFSPKQWGQKTAAAKPNKSSSYIAPDPRGIRPVRFVLAAPGQAPGVPPEMPAPNDNSPRVHLSIDNAGSDYIANGSDAAVISAYFESPDGSAAPRNIDLWLSYTRGSLEPGVLQIPKGSYAGSTRLTSNWPGDVRITFVSSNPGYPVEGSTQFDVPFVPLGVILAGPDKLSVIDDAPVLVVFVNDRGPIAPGRDWPVTLHTSESKLLFDARQSDRQGRFAAWIGLALAQVGGVRHDRSRHF